MPQDYDAIVIGSGIGGLACASLLTQLGDARVLVLERHFKAGGQTHDFRREGFVWDVGLHYVGEMEPGDGERHLLDVITGGEVRWNPLPDPYDVFIYPGFRFEVPFGEARYRERLQARFPTQARAIERYFDDIHHAGHWMQMQMAHKAMPHWMRLMSGLLSRDRAGLALLTTGEYLNQHFTDPLLKSVLVSQWGDYGLSPEESAFGIHALATASFFAGAYYPEGGGRGIAQGAVGVIEAGGGACLRNREVCELLFEGERVVGVVARHAQGEHEQREQYRAPIVVSDIGARETYLKLVPETVALPFRGEIERFRHGHSAVSVYFGLRHGPEAIGISGANYWIYDDRDHDAMRRRSGATLDGDPPYVFVSFPSARDPLAKRPTATAIVTVDYEAFAKWSDSRWHDRPAEYEQIKRTIADGVIALIERSLPGFAELVEFVEVSTPLTLAHFTGRAHGAIYGVPAIPDKFRRRWCEIETPIPGLYLTGTDVACLGVVGAAIGGLMTTGKLLGGREFGRVMQQMAPTHG